jgi:hypothetical protein
MVAFVFSPPFCVGAALQFNHKTAHVVVDSRAHAVVADREAMLSKVGDASGPIGLSTTNARFELYHLVC